MREIDTDAEVEVTGTGVGRTAVDAAKLVVV